MKIAVLLRGQMKNYQLGAALMQKTLRDRYPHIEFKVFVHTWTTTPIQVNPSQENPMPREAILEEHSYEEIEKRVQHFNPVSYRIDSPHILSKLMKEITDINYKDSKFIEWFEEYVDNMELEYHSDGIPIATMLLPTKRKPMTIRKMLITHYHLSQCYSASAVYNVYKEYCREHDYKPDLILCTRPDAVLVTHKPCYKNVFEEVLDELTRSYADEINPRQDYPVMVRSLMGLHDHLWFCDWLFLMLPDYSDRFFGTNTDEHFTKIFTKDKHKLLGNITEYRNFNHSFWAHYGSGCTFLNSTYLPNKELSRDEHVSGYNYDELMNIEEMDLLTYAKKTRLTYNHLLTNKEITTDTEYTIDIARKIVLGDIEWDHKK